MNTERKIIYAADAAEKISDKLGIPLPDLVDIFAEVKSAEVVTREEYGRLSRRNAELEEMNIQLCEIVEDIKALCDKFFGEDGQQKADI